MYLFLYLYCVHAEAIRKTIIMESISYTNLRSNLAAILDKVEADHRPVLITRQKARLRF